MSRFFSIYKQTSKFIAAVTSNLPKSVNTISIRHVSLSSKLLDKFPQIQKPAPSFAGTAVINGDFQDIQLSDYRGKYVVFFFYPLDFTFVCPTELIAFSDRIKEFEQLSTQVIAASTDSQYSHYAWTKTPRKEGGLGGDLGYPLLSDYNKDISRAYNILVEDIGVALRALYIIDRDGILRHFSVNDLPVGRSVDETLRLVKAFQHVEKHGEVCPANWQPDTKTIKPNPKDSKKFFESVN